MQHRVLEAREVEHIVREYARSLDLKNKRVLVIVPDNTRTAPIGQVFRALFDEVVSQVRVLDVMIALGTHPPLSESEIERRLDISHHERTTTFANVNFLNHAWSDAQQLQEIGTLSREEVRKLSNGLFEMEVPVTINKAVFSYDQIIIIGPVFPHEVVGFSGGNKYLFPGIGGPEILNFFHWLGALVTNIDIIGQKYTPVRRVVDKAASLLTVPTACFCLVVREKLGAKNGELAGLFVGAPEAAWSQAADLSALLHVVYKDAPFHTVLSCAPPMYDDLWVGGKCMYKLEPVVADGGELIIYAPHISEVPPVHGALISQIGCHTRDYFTAQWQKYKDVPWGVLAHSTHVKGAGKYENGTEKPRVNVTLATQIPPDVCAKINLGYRGPATIDIESFADREDEGILLVRKAGEMLYRLKNLKTELQA